jgi:hypothetical protein
VPYRDVLTVQTRCDGTQPGCKTCEVYNDECHYDKLPPMSQIVKMAKKLQEAEQLVAELRAAAHPAATPENGTLDALKTYAAPDAANLRSAIVPLEVRQHSEVSNPTVTTSTPYSPENISPRGVGDVGRISDLSVDENGKLCYYGPTSAVHDPTAIGNISTTDEQYDSPAVKSNVRSMLTSKAMESRAWEDFAVGNAAFRSDIPRATLSHLLNMHWSWVAPMFMWVYRPAFMRTLVHHRRWGAVTHVKKET